MIVFLFLFTKYVWVAMGWGVGRDIHSKARIPAAVLPA